MHFLRIFAFSQHMYLAENKLVTSTPPSPFGTPLYNRGFEFSDYRYGFNGKEKDDEVFGVGNCLNYGKRVQDTRLGRFFSVDPLTKQYPQYSSYQFAGNDVIRNDDLDGLEPNAKIVDHNYNIIVIPGSDQIQHQIPSNAEPIYKGPEGSAGKIMDKDYALLGTAVSFFLPIARLTALPKLIEAASAVKTTYYAGETFIYTVPALYKAVDNTFGGGSVEYGNLPGQVTHSAYVDLVFTEIAVAKDGIPTTAVDGVGFISAVNDLQEDNNKILDNKKSESPPPANTTSPEKTDKKETGKESKKDTKSQASQKKDSTPAPQKKRCEKKDSF